MAVLAAGLALLPGCGPPGLGRGVWLSADGAEQYVLSFEHTGGLLAGKLHHVRGGRQIVQWGFAGTRGAGGRIELSWGANNTMSATVDLAAGELRGTVILADGSVLEALFRRAVAAEIPGLAALSELPYELRPPASGSGWEVAEPEAVGIGPSHLEATVRAVTRGEAGLLHSLLIARRGKLVLEEYFHGYARGDLHEMQSATKSVASLLIGIARDRGAIGEVGTPVLEWFPERADSAAPGWQGVTLEHLLTMTAGLDWDAREAGRANLPGPALFDEVLSRRVAHEPGSRWLYNNADLELLGGVLLRATGMQADELAARALFAPLGIGEWDWETGRAEGYPSLAGGLHLRPVDMAKIGQLVLDGGRWRGRQVVSEAWIRRSTEPRIAIREGGPRYGYLWLRLAAPLDAGPYPVTAASGKGGQTIYVAPALEAVIVVTGGNHFTGKDHAIDQVLLRELLPGVRR